MELREFDGWLAGVASGYVWAMAVAIWSWWSIPIALIGLVPAIATIRATLRKPL